LHYAATSGHLPIIELLLEQHAVRSPNGGTPLMMAALARRRGQTAAGGQRRSVAA
jgi:ankyrin repeat protein